MRVVIASRFDDQVRHSLVHRGWDVVDVAHKPGQWVFPETELIAAIRGADCLVTEADEITRRVMQECSDLKTVINCRGNSVNVDIQAATDEGVLIAGTPGRNSEAVADLCVCMMLMVARNIGLAMESLRNGMWANSPRATVYLACQGHELPEKTVGLVGLGTIGRGVARRLGGFGMEVLACDPFVTQSIADTVGARMVSLDELVTRSDFISLHAQVTPETRGMIGEREFGMMKPTAYLINTARAELVDEQAMMEALCEKRIAGAALDVYHKEPLQPDSLLLALPNVLLLPHIGGATYDVIRHQSKIAEANLEAVRQGRVPPTLVNLDVLRSPRLRLPRLAALSEERR